LDELPSDLPQGVVAVVEKALAKDPAGRFQTTAEMVEALQRAVAEAPVPAKVAPPPRLAEAVEEKPVEAAPSPPQPEVAPPRLVELVAMPEEEAMPFRRRVSEWVQALGALVARRVPSWAWALGALVVVATIAIAFYILRPKLGGAVLFTSDRDGKREVYRLTSTAEVQRVTYTPGNTESWSPALAPDDAILFTSDRDGKREVYRLTSTGEVQRATYTPNNGESWSPASAPDDAILFTSDRDGKWEIYRLTSTAEVQRVTYTPNNGESWSQPD